jgi:hypothetical protein
MSSQAAVLTVLPRGRVDANMLRLAVHVAPRLTPGGASGELGDGQFPDFAKWGALDPTWEVSFDGSAPLGTQVVTDPPRDPALWTALFGPQTLVRGHSVPDFTDFPTLSFPAGSVVDKLQEWWTAALLASPEDHPPLDDAFGLLEPIAFTGEDDKNPMQTVLKKLDDERTTQGFNSFEQGVNASPSAWFVALKEFYNQPVDGSKPIPEKKFDFHEVLALLASHPRVLRALGLVVDLQVSARLIASLGPETTVNVVAPELPEVDFATPGTVCVIDPTTFAARQRPTNLQTSDLARGHLRLGLADRFRLLTVDGSGAGLKTLNFATTLKRLKDGRGTEDSPDRLAFPTLRAAGLAVIRRERAAPFVAKLNSDIALNGEVVQAIAGAAPPPDVFLEDVVRGYGVDVWERSAKKWRSLIRRTGTVTFTESGAVLDVPDSDLTPDEAAVSAPPTRPAGENAPKRHYLHQRIADWAGWSLAVPAPGVAIARDGTLDPEPADAPYPVAFDLSVPPGSLPRLRFGEQYGIRMRAFDLAGAIVPFDSGAADDDAELVAKETYLRWEPIASPVLALQAPTTAGENVARLVIRSEHFSQSVAEPGTRHVVTPKAGQLLAEHHGMFDTLAQGSSIVDGGQATYDLIVGRESGSLDQAPGAQPDTGDPSGHGFVIPTLTALPYLPDPAARGVLIRFIEGDPHEPVIVGDLWPPPAKAWHEGRPFRVVAAPATANGGLGPSAEPKLGEDSDGPLVTIEVPKGYEIRLALSCLPTLGILERFGVWHWLRQALAGNPLKLREFTSLAYGGRIWGLSPSRPLVLVHAVRRPLKTPEWVKPVVKRQLGQTFARIADDNFTFSRRSTGKVEVFGSWAEFVDSGPNGLPPTLPDDPSTATQVSTLAFEVPLVRKGTAPPEPEHDVLDVDDVHEFGDTKRRDVTYRAVATTRFLEEFRRAVKVAAAAQPVALPTADPFGGTSVLAESVVVRNLQDGTVYRRGTGYAVQESPPQVTLTVTGAPGSIPVGAPIEISYLVPPFTRTTEDPVPLTVKSSARPDAPKVLYVIPTFRWSGTAGASSTRLGGGLRVYMERPWWSSGGGELLGVVLAKTPPPAGAEDRLAPYVTRWGLDPLFKGASLPAPTPGFAEFPLSPAEQRGFDKTLDERPGLLVNVAGHQVAFDETRDLWYCDIDVDAGLAYTPFVRLALARFQPQSLDGAHLSRVALADFVQLAPDRALSITTPPGRTSSVTVVLTGRSYSKAGPDSRLAGPGLARVLVEQQDPSHGSDDELGWAAVGDWIPMTGSFPLLGGGSAQWTADVPLPGGRKGKRLVVEQYEEVLADPKPNSAAGPFPVVSRRLVYSDIVRL